MPTPRPSKFSIYQRIAQEWARLATCPRLQVGAVVVDEAANVVRASAYNGAPTGEPHCCDVGCLVIDDHCRRAIHAEDNLCIFAGRPQMQGQLVVITHSPCFRCAGLLVQTGIRALAFLEYYRSAAYSQPALDRLRAAGIEVWHAPCDA